MIRTLIIAITCILFATTASAQRKTLRHFMVQHYDVASTQKIGLGFLTFRVVSWFIPDRAFDGKMKDIKWALKKVRKARFYALEMDYGVFSTETVMGLRQALEQNNKFELLAEVRHENANIHLLSNGRNEDRIDNLVVLVQEDGEMIMLHLRTRLTMDDITRIVNTVADEVKLAGR
ncbi:DUF4252 domain-containing protein [Chitinophaga rhizosphaerae]|uniref:DUF4252 domain-containing protein n=1 Tax=Chitinophaga rhizosphaerae TaxID=1864947 RepID=UPI000F7FD490|nr:DUF4252 domain-containing protein [Chitinophaga rhizosphaerae]